MKHPTHLFLLLISSTLGASVCLTTLDATPAQSRNAPTEPQAAVNPDDEYGIVETVLSCEEANHISRRSVERLGYKVESFTPATADTVGVLKGGRPFIWGDTEAVTIKISCTPERIDIDARPDVPPCEQANRISRLAVEHLGYKVTTFTPAAVGKPGIVKGAKAGQPEVFITLFCEGRMVTMDTSMDSPLLHNSDFFIALTDFRRGFFATYKAQRGVVSPKTLPVASDQLQVFVRPLSKLDAKAALGSEITNLLAVLVEVTNPTKRAYQLDPEKIMLVSIAGDRVKPLPEKGHAFPVQALAHQSVAPGGTLKGYLYFPLGAYSGARGALTDEKSQEREGFEVPF
jgi:hypothetical protein